MAWQTPRTNWSAVDGVWADDLNRIEGNTLHVYNNLTDHIDAPNAHGATSNATPNRIPIRDADGNFFVGPPKDGWHVARKAEIDNHANNNLAHNATPSLVANRIMSRDGNGRAAVANPVNNDHIANKQYVDSAANAALQAAKDWANAENVTTIPYRAANVPGSNYPVGVTAFEVSNGTADGWIVNQGTVLSIRLAGNFRMTQIFTHSTTNGSDTTYIRTWRSDVGWSNFKKIPMEHLSNTFTENQTIENSDYRYWGVRRGNNGAEIAVSSSGYAQLVKREGGNIVESISIRGAGDARVGNARIWHDDNLSSPARTNFDNNFTQTQTFNTPNVTGNWTVIRLKRDQNGVGDFGLSMRNDGRLSVWDYINERTLILFGDDRVVIGSGVTLDVFDNALTSSATPTGSGNGYFRNAYIHSANPSGGRNGDVYYKY